MRFSRHVVKLSFANTPMVGNLANGYSIGLSDEGAKICDRLFCEDVEKTEIALVDEALFEHLLAGGFFDEGSCQQPLGSAYLHVTQRCNLDCLGCYSFDRHRNKLEDPSFEQLSKAIRELSLGGVTSLVISGGEPFLRDDLPELLSYAKSECKIQTINVATNGTILSRDTLKKIAPSVDMVSVSFDGFSRSSPAPIRKEQRFDQLVDTVNALNDYGIAAKIVPTIHSKNINELTEYISLSQSLHATVSYSLFTGSFYDDEIAGLIPNDDDLCTLGATVFAQNSCKLSTVEDAPLGISLSLTRTCGAGTKTVSVAADGSVYPCHMLHVEDFKMGNLFCDSIVDVLGSLPALAFRKSFSSANEDCANCSYRWFCGGGCKARSYMAFGSFCKNDPYCPMFKSFYGCFEQQLIQQLDSRKEV